MKKISNTLILVSDLGVFVTARFCGDVRAQYLANTQVLFIVGSMNLSTGLGTIDRTFP